MKCFLYWFIKSDHLAILGFGNSVLFYSVERCDLQVFVFYGIFLELRRYIYGLFIMTERSDNATVILCIATIQKQNFICLNLTVDIGHALALRKLYKFIAHLCDVGRF